MVSETRDSYDQVPYESYAFRRTHPDHLAVLATLFGMQPPRVDRCRVLEVGCAAGGNLIPMALGLPESRFLGIDLSGRQIDDGRRAVEALGLTNVELRQASVMDIDAGFGGFDYVIAHGIYSWVPAAVQDKILSVCAANLTPCGVAYVSYNTLPGWHQRGMIREIMCHHTRHFDEPAVKAEQARAVLRFLADAVGRESAYGQVLAHEVDMLADLPDYYLYHEYLERDNYPIYFHEFAARAAAHGLQYVAEAHFEDMMLHDFPVKVQQALEPLAADRLEREQYIDFLRNRKFRQTVLCRQDVRLQPELTPEAMYRFHLSSRAEPVERPPGTLPEGAEEFRAPDADAWAPTSPLTRAAMRHLRQAWPAAVPFDRLVAAAHSRLGRPDPPPGPDDAGVQQMAAELLYGYAARVLWLHTHPPTAATVVSVRPVASPVARLQAANRSMVATLDHSVAQLGELDRQVLLRLDGTRTLADLVDDLAGLVRTGALVHRDGDQAAPDDAGLRMELSVQLAECLSRFVRCALLVR